MTGSSKWTNLSGGSTLSQGPDIGKSLDHSLIESNKLAFGFIPKSLVCLVSMATSGRARPSWAHWESRVYVWGSWTTVLDTVSLAWGSQRPPWMSFIIMDVWAERPLNSCFPFQKTKHLGKEEWRGEISRESDACVISQTEIFHLSLSLRAGIWHLYHVDHYICWNLKIILCVYEKEI